MKDIVRFSVAIIVVCIGLVNANALPKDEQVKINNYNSINGILSTPKPDLLNYNNNYGVKFHQPQQIYQPIYQSKNQYNNIPQALPYNHQPEPFKKPYFSPQQATPVAMVIIAQPAYIPASMLQQSNVAQQLLQLFQGGNSQMRYQYVPPNHQPVYQPLVSAHQPVVQPQQSSQYYQYQVQSSDFQPSSSPSSLPQAPQAQTSASTSQFFAQESLPTPQALISQPSLQQSRKLNQPSSTHHHQSGRSYGNDAPEIEFQPQELQQIEEENNENVPNNNNADYNQLAQQAAQHFVNNGGLRGGSRTAPAIITGLEHFSPEQQEKIKKQLSAHFGSPLKQLTLGEQQQQQQKDASNEHRSLFGQEDKKQKIRGEKFIPSLQVKDGEITQRAMSGEKM